MERRRFIASAASVAGSVVLSALASRVIAQATSAPRVIPVVARKFVFIPGSGTPSRPRAR